VVNEYTLPWGAWSGGEESHILTFPDEWEVNMYDMKGSKDIKSPQAIQEALKNPIGTQTIQEIAEVRKNAVIVVEDISRPTKCALICEIVLDELNKAGIDDENITLIGAIGSHRPMMRGDYIKKVGLKTVQRINIENHHPYENLVELGESDMGTPIHVNKTYYEADMKIAIGTVIPHPLAGFGGGAKIILPGISGIETLAANHAKGLEGRGIGLGFITEIRKDIEEVCKRVGLDFNINIIATKNRGIAGIFAGHYVNAHRKAIEFAKEVYKTELPEVGKENKLDVGLFNLFPEDTELSQAGKGNNMFIQIEHLLQEEAAVVLLTSSYEGRGFHSLLGETGGKLHGEFMEGVELLKEFCEEKTFILYSPNLSRADVDHYWGEDMLFSKNFSEIIMMVEKVVGESPKAAIFPTSIQLL
jgi:nickel-dependent lactate racemase